MVNGHGNVHNNAEAFVVAMDDSDKEYDYPEVVRYHIRETEQKDYLATAKLINFTDADICVLQHEYGIFGGESGIYLLPLINNLTKPLIVTLHTVLKNPSFNEKSIIQEIAKKAEKLVVMSQLAMNFLMEKYGIPGEKIAVIEHGVPDFDFTDRESFKSKFNLKGKKSLFTFGLLSRDKGIETVINALPKVVSRHPDLLYIVLGKTHPGVVKASGEEYRNYLVSLVEKNNLRDHVNFIDRFATNEELFGYLAASDIYLIPNFNKAQITSGTLAYAVGAGSAVVSTNFWHAQGLLAEGRGRLFHPGDSNQLAAILDELLSNPSTLDDLRIKAYQYGRKTRWPVIGEQYLALVSETLTNWTGPALRKEPVINPLALPDFQMSHVHRLTDDTGILQHANFTVANLKEGYCLDDNIRALLLCVMAYRQKGLQKALKLMHRYLSFAHFMQNEDGTFRNFLAFDRRFLDEIGSEDCFGRTIWTLGYLLRFSPNDAYSKIGEDMFLKAFPHFKEIKSLRGIAYTAIGIAHYLHHSPTNLDMLDALEKLTAKLVGMYNQSKAPDWHWFESKLTYANGILPLALFQSYERTRDKNVLEVAIETMEFLEEVCFKHGFFSPVGSDSWYEKGGQPAKFAQQPIDAMAMVLMYYQAYYVLGDARYARLMSSTFKWFLGENELGIPLYDFQSHGCCDGLESHGISKNQGAESTLAYHIAYLTVLLAHEKY